MLNLYITLERVALATPLFGCASRLDGIAEAIALVFTSEILHHPWSAVPVCTCDLKATDGNHVRTCPERQTEDLNKTDPHGASDRRVMRMSDARRDAWEKLRKPRDLRHFVVLVIRDLQEQARGLLTGRGYELGTGLLAPLDEHQTFVLETWDKFGGHTAVYAAFERQIGKV